jgi:uncharacterized Zn ribbon protein
MQELAKRRQGGMSSGTNVQWKKLFFDQNPVVLTRSLDVKGSSLDAKMGTVVKNIRVVEDNTEQIEGKIDGQLIVILTKYLRKQG